MEIRFGKRKGQQIEDVFKSDPGYVKWIATYVDKPNGFRMFKPLQAKARELLKSENIFVEKAPDKDPYPDDYPINPSTKQKKLEAITDIEFLVKEKHIEVIDYIAKIKEEIAQS